MIKRNILDCMTLVGGTPLRFEGEKTYVSTGAVDCDHVDYAQTERVTYDNRPSRANLSVAEGDILFAKMCGTKKTLRIDRPLSEHLYSTGFCAVRANESLMDAALLYHLLASDQFLTQKDQNSSGATQKAITNAGLRKIVIQVPDLPEQRKLAANLDCIEQMMANRREQLVSFDQLVKSRFIELFGDIVLNPFGWEKDYLGVVCDVRDGTHDSPHYHSTGFPLVTSKNVTGGEIDLTDCSLISEADFNKINERSKVDMGDIIMPMIGTVGKPVIVNVKPNFAIKNVSLIKFKDDSRVLNTFIRSLLQSDYFDDAVLSKVRGGTQKFISLGDIRKLVVIVPPMELQEQFAAFVEQTDKSKLYGKMEVAA